MDEKDERTPDPVYLDLMPDEEVEELRKLSELGDDAQAHAERQIREGGDAVRGLYESFFRNGLVLADFNGLPLAVTRWGSWAIANHDRKAAEKAKAREEQWAHDGKVAIIGGALGIIGTLAGTVLGAFLSWLAQGVHP